MTQSTQPFFNLFSAAIDARAEWFTPPHSKAFRLFNGFTEGDKQFSVDIFGQTAVINDYRDQREIQSTNNVDVILRILKTRVPFLKAVIYKQRKGKVAADRNGTLLLGDSPDTRIIENNIKYAASLTLNRDAGFYIDTRNVRKWAKENLAGKSVLNTFAYTGSLGIAAMAAEATVVQTDLNRTFLNLAKQSCSMNGFPVRKKDFITGDFFMVMKQLTRQERLFDCAFIDPPFFSNTTGGTVDLENNMIRLINKIRPLIKNNGQIVAINNAVFLSGKKYMATLEELCKDEYVSIDTIIPVPEDCTGYPTTVTDEKFIDATPFNHSTKVVVLNIHHKE